MKKMKKQDKKWYIKLYGDIMKNMIYNIGDYTIIQNIDDKTNKCVICDRDVFNRYEQCHLCDRIVCDKCKSSFQIKCKRWRDTALMYRTRKACVKCLESMSKINHNYIINFILDGYYDDRQILRTLFMIGNRMTRKDDLIHKVIMYNCIIPYVLANLNEKYAHIEEEYMKIYGK